ncbi:hypothetical protein CAEBREN_13309 [Caenorhabditis brenneri]|uniref:GLTSCR protein conserved domain-containing protein n=1 Tax=Caenorhabditis brenneri TaxID=135651 RepID=G0NU71_CAEBE|nr:hypothetical protein CAEBREN_13309 [Caenorhabditis brenneri]
MSYPDEDWFQYTNDFNQRAESPGGNGAFNFESGNIDNIPLNDDDPQGVEFDLNGPIDEFQYDTLGLTPGQNEQPGTSGSNDIGGQFQSMHVMQNNDTFDQHMHQSSSMEYNSFEMPTVISTNLDAGPYQDLGIIDDPNSFYASQQPSTSQGNDMLLTDNYDMMGQQTAYLAQVDHIDPSTAGNPSSHSGMNQQNDNSVPVQQPPPKSKPKKRSTAKKKPATSAGDTVGSVLQKAANRNSEQVENNNDNQEIKKPIAETRVSLNDTMVVIELNNALNRLRQDTNADQSEIQNLESQILQLLTKNMVTQGDNQVVSLMNMTGAAGTSTQPTPPPPLPPPKKAPSKKKNTKSAQQQQQQQSQPQMMPPPQAQITPAKIVMEPPTTTMVPSNSHMQNMYEGVNESYSGYHQIDEQGTSQQQYNDFQQPHSQESVHHQNQAQQHVIHTKVVPTMNQRTHNFRQSVALPSQNVNGSGPSPHLQQPRSHDSHQTEQVQDQQYHSQDHRRPQSRQVYPPVNQHHHDGQAYQSQEAEPTLGDVVRQTQGRYQGPQDAPNLRQQLISNVNASTNKQLLQRSGAPTPSPGNFHNNNIQQQQQYVDTYQNHSSYPSSHDMQPSSQSQQGYESHQQYDPVDDFYDSNQSRSQEQEAIQMQPESRQQQYEQEEMYAPIQEPEPVVDESEMYYVELPVRTVEASKETLEEKLEEKRLIRAEKVKNLMTGQLSQLENGIDLTPFRGKLDILERMLPFHHLSVGEEPVSNFDSTYDKVMSNAITHANELGSRIRNILLRDTMRKSTEWEENMLLFLETESERRKLEEDRQLATQDLQSFLQNSDVIQNVQNGRLDLEQSKQAVPPMPDHLKDSNLKPDELSTVYKEYEFDSYDENRPRGSPFAYEELESESEFEEEHDEENEEVEDEQPTRSDISPLVGFQQPSPIPSPSRDRNESESTFDWKDEDESPLLSPETEIYKKVTDDLFGTQEDLEKSEPFPFKEISDAARRQLLQQPGIAESIGSSNESSSTSGSPPRNNNQAKARFRSPKPTSYARTPSPGLIGVPVPPTVARPIYRVNLDEGSPEIGEDYSMSPEPPPTKPPRRKKNVSATSEDVRPIHLPVEVSKIKEEKEDSTQGLRLRIPVDVYQKGVKLATNEVEEPLTKKSTMELESDSTGRSTSRRNSRSTPSSGSAIESEPSSSKKISKASVMLADDATTGVSRHDASIFKTPFQTPLKTTVSDSRKRRGDKIDDSTPHNKKCKNIGSFETPKNGLIESDDASIGRFLRTMTDGRRIVMKIGKIPNNINHFVTPRRDKKGNLHKNLSPTKNTRLKMRLFKRNGELAVEVTEHCPASLEAGVSDTSMSNEPSTSSASVAIPVLPTAIHAKGRPAPASRKPSLEASGKEKKTHLPKNKIAYTNRFNPFANSTSSKPPTSTVTPLSRPSISIIQSSSKPSKSITPNNSSRNATSTNSSYLKPTTSSSATKPSTSTIRKSSTTVPFSSSSSRIAPPMNSVVSTAQTVLKPSGLPSSSLSMMQANPGSGLIRTTPIVPKITVTNTPVAPEEVSESTETVEHNKTMSSLQPWIFDTNINAKPRSTRPQAVPTLDPVSVTPTTKERLQVNTDRSEDHAALAQQEVPRAPSSLSILFDDDKILRSPQRTNEPLPLVEYSDDEDSDLVHSQFRNATDHLLGTSNMNNPVNGTTSLVPWTDP